MNNGISDAGSPKRIVVIGGGTGLSTLLQGLRGHNVDISAIVTMFDSGGSSGRLREEFSYPPFGDLRQCLLALSSDSQENRAFREAFGFRFGDETSLNGHSVGNLLLAALTSLKGDNLEHAIEEASRILQVDGRVIPVTLTTADLCAELEDGQIIRGESEIDLRKITTPRIKRIYLEPEMNANPTALKVIEEADAVVFGPGDLYTSILPNLLVNGMPEAIASCDAVRIFICNLMTKRGETDGFGASDFVGEMISYLPDASLDWVAINTSVPSSSILTAYEEEHADLVEPQLESVREMVPGVLATSLATSDLPLRHSPDRTAEAVFQVLEAGRICGVAKDVALLPNG